MDYQLLSEPQKARIRSQKLLELEAEHARLELDIRLSRATGVNNDNVAAAEQQLNVIADQITTLRQWITETSESAQAELVPANGRSATSSSI